MSVRSAVPPYYFFLHPVSTSLFMYILMRSMFHTLWNDGIVLRGKKAPREDVRQGMGGRESPGIKTSLQSHAHLPNSTPSRERRKVPPAFAHSSTCNETASY